MKIIFEKKVLKDFDKVDNNLLIKLQILFNKFEEIDNFNDFGIYFDLKKLKNFDKYYRIRIGDYRLGFSFELNEIKLIRFLHRKDIYKFFPK